VAGGVARIQVKELSARNAILRESDRGGQEKRKRHRASLGSLRRRHSEKLILIVSSARTPEPKGGMGRTESEEAYKVTDIQQKKTRSVGTFPQRHFPRAITGDHTVRVSGTARSIQSNVRKKNLEGRNRRRGWQVWRIPRGESPPDSPTKSKKKNKNGGILHQRYNRHIKEIREGTAQEYANREGRPDRDARAR